MIGSSSSVFLTEEYLSGVRSKLLIAGGLIAGKKMKRKKFLWGLLLGSLYFLILFAVSAALAGGLPKDLVHMGTTLGICMAAGTLGGMMS